MDMSVLTRKIGPLPGWAWGGLIAGALWWFFIRGKGSTGTGTPNAAASGSQLASGYGLGFAQGQQAAQANTTTSSSSAAGQPNASVAGIRAGNVGNETGHDYYGGSPPGTLQKLGQLPFETPVQITGAPTVANVPWQNTTVPVPVYPLKGPAGQPIYMQTVDVVPGAGGLGVGGPGTARKHAIGSRSAWLHHDAHPLIGAPVRYAHYVRAVGGPANHRREVARVAHQAGVHPARVAMLNPEYTGHIRIA